MGKKLINDIMSVVDEYQGEAKLKIGKDILEKMIFIYTSVIGEKYKTFSVPKNILEKIDLSEVSFDDFDVYNVDFSGLTGVKINPQKVAYKSLCGSKLNGVEITGTLDGCHVVNTDFTGVKGFNKIDPQKCYGKSLYGAKLNGLEITGSLNGIYVVGTDFTGIIGNNKLNPQKVSSKSLCSAKLNDMEITGSYDDTWIEWTDFTGVKGNNKIDPQTIKLKSLYGANLNGMEIIGSLDDVNFDQANFDGSIDNYNKKNKSLVKKIKGRNL